MEDVADDHGLLDAYARARSQEAFAGLVAKYADMVFGTALRRTRDWQLAEDVTQAVFIVLARRAGSLRGEGSLGGWLHRTTLYAAANAVRAEDRRRRRERNAARPELVREPPKDQVSDLLAAVEEQFNRLRAAERQLL